MSDLDRLEIRIKPWDPVNTQWQVQTNNGQKKHQNQPGWKETTTHTTKEAGIKQIDDTSLKNKTETGEPLTSGMKMPRETPLNPGRRKHQTVTRQLRRYSIQTRKNLRILIRHWHTGSG